MVQCSNAPSLVRWDITKRCNLSCKHCITGDKYKRTQELSTEEKKNVIDKMAKFGVKRIHLLGGEPTLTEDFEELIDYMAEHEIKVSMNTNGIKLERGEMAVALAKRKIDISFSIDGAESRTHDIIRGRNTFETVCNATQRYSELTGYSDEVVRAFYYTITPDNQNDDIEQLYKLGTRIGVNNIIIGVMIPQGNGGVNYTNTIDIDTLIRITVKVAEISKKYPNIRTSFPYQTPVLLKYLNEITGYSETICYAKCKSGINEYSLEVDGTLYPCIYVNTALLNKIDGSYCFKPEDNSLKHKDMEEIVNNHFYSFAKNMMSKYSVTDYPDVCINCEYSSYYGICKPCCFQNYIGNSDEFHKYKLCEKVKEIIKERE